MFLISHQNVATQFAFLSSKYVLHSTFPLMEIIAIHGCDVFASDKVNEKKTKEIMQSTHEIQSEICHADSILFDLCCFSNVN